MAFIPRKEVSTSDIRYAVIANSQTLAVGDAVIPAATGHVKFLTGINGGTVGVFGVVVGIVNGLNKAPLEKTSVTVASNNETVGAISVAYIPAHLPIEFVADLDAAAGTTNADSAGTGTYFGVKGSTNSLLAESSYVIFGGNVANLQFQASGVNPQNSSQVFGRFIRTTTQ